MKKYLLVALTACALVAGCDLFVSPQQRVERAAALIQKGDYEAAAIELRNALRKEPDNARGRLLLARTELWAGDPAAAGENLERAVAAGAKPAETARLNAEIRKALGQYQALATYAARPTPGLQEYERLMFLGYAQLGLSKVDAALASFDAAVRAAGTGLPVAEARSAQAAGLAASGDVQGALSILDSVLAARPDYRPAALSKANLLLRRGDYAEAEQILSALNSGGQRSRVGVAERVTVLVSLGEVRLGQRKLAEAGQSVRELAALLPDSPVTTYMQGRLALAQGQVAVAITELQKTVRDAPALMPGHVMLGVAYLSQGNAAQAEAEFLQALEEAPDNVEVRKLLAQAQIRQGRADSAALALAPALEAGSRDPGVYALAGQARLMQGDREAGNALLERVLAENPDSPRLRLEMAGTYLATGDPQRALDLVGSVPDDVGGDAKKQIQFLALAAGKDKAAAKLAIDTLVRKNPKDARLLNLAAAWLANQGDVAGARAYLDQALAVVPADSRTLVNLGRLDMRARRNEEASKSFQSALVSDPKNGDAYLALAAMADSAGDKVGVARWLADWSKADPAAAQPRLLLARIAFRDKDPRQGHGLVDESLKLVPNSASVEAAAGQVLMDAGLYDEALGHFRNAARIDARDPTYLFGAARAQLAMEQRGAARDSLNRALALRPNWVPATVLLAQIELKERRVDAALSLADGFKKDAAGAPTGYLLEGDIRLAVGQAAQAADAYAESTKLHPSAEAAIGESRARRVARLPRPAEPLLAWLERSPDDARVRLELAQTYMADGGTGDAIREYERVLQVQPDNLIALNNLAALYGERGDPRAEPLARQALAMAPRSGPIADTLGWILFKSGNVDESLKILEQAHDLDNKNPEITYHLGAALLKAGRKSEARAALASAVDGGSTAPWVSEARKLLAEAG